MMSSELESSKICESIVFSFSSLLRLFTFVRPYFFSNFSGTVLNSVYEQKLVYTGLLIDFLKAGS